jgi:hypothetical protein
MTVIMNASVFWNITPCSLIEIRWHFGESTSGNIPYDNIFQPLPDT